MRPESLVTQSLRAKARYLCRLEGEIKTVQMFKPGSLRLSPEFVWRAKKIRTLRSELMAQTGITPAN